MSTHFLQSQYWKKIKEALGNKTYNSGRIWFQTTKVPVLGSYVGYVPRAELKNINWENLLEAGKKANCAYISIDPVDIKFEFQKNGNKELTKNLPSFYQKPSKYNLKIGIPTHLQENAIIDLSKSEQELLSNMKQKHRYNLKLAQKKGVKVEISDSKESFEIFLTLYSETVKRQKYFGRSESYLRTVWNILKEESKQTDRPLTLIATASFEDKPLSSWMLFLYEDTIYYPYGGSSEEHKNAMPTYALIWQIIKWGKSNGYSYLDLWGIEPPKEKDEINNMLIYDGFSRFKLGFGGMHIVYSDTIDLIINATQYKIIKTAYFLRENFKFIKRI